MLLSCAMLVAPATATASAEAAESSAPAGTAENLPDPNAPISGKLVPAIRGEAARTALGPGAAENFLKLRELRDDAGGVAPAVHPPWSGFLHQVWGSFPTVSSQGMMATHTVNPGITFSPNNHDFIYAPTMMPSGTACIEAVTVYSDNGKAVAAWDWCSPNPGFAADIFITPTFLSTYTTTVNGRPAYTVQDVQTNPVTNSWTTYLFNFRTRAWDALYTSADPGKLSNPGGGWDMFEVWTVYNPSTGQGYYCSDSFGTQFQAVNIRIRLNGTWNLLTTGNSSLTPPGQVTDTFGCDSGTTSLSVVTPNSNWRVTR